MYNNNKENEETFSISFTRDEISFIVREITNFLSWPQNSKMTLSEKETCRNILTKMYKFYKLVVRR